MKKIFVLMFALSVFSYSSTLNYNQVKDVNGITINGSTKYPFTGMVKKGKNREFYKNGKPDGKWIYFYSNGNIKSIENWKDGKLHGKYILYSSNGEKYLETKYKKGLDNGNYKIYYSDGKLRIAGKLRKGKPIGSWENYTTEYYDILEENTLYANGEKNAKQN
ncbi:MAG: toxin-antitoxin system YwqK family antitoxin [Fusobacterium sp.]